MRTLAGSILFAAMAACSAQKPALSSSAGESKSDELPFIEDDYPRALAEARARKVPLFVDAWAPW